MKVYANAQDTARDRSGPAASGVERVRERLIQAGRPEALRGFEENLRDVRTRARLTSMTWTEGQDHTRDLRMSVTGEIAGPFRADGDRVLLRLPEDPGVFVLESTAEVTAEGPAGSIRVVLRNGSEEHLLAGVGGLGFAIRPEAEPESGSGSGSETDGAEDASVALAFDVEASIDPYDLPARGPWELIVHISACGWSGAIPVGLADLSIVPPPALLPGGRTLSFRTTLLDRFRVDVDAPAGALVGRWSPAPGDARLVRDGTGARFELDVPLITASEASPVAALTAWLVLASTPDPPVELPATLRGGTGSVGVLSARVPASFLDRTGHYAVGLCVDGRVDSLGLDLSVYESGETAIRPTEAVSVAGVDTVSEARGEYVLIADPAAAPVDDALAQMYAYARECQADVVVGRTAVGSTLDGVFRSNARRRSMISALGKPAIFHRSLTTDLPANRLAATALMLLRAGSIAVLADRVCFSPGLGAPGPLEQLAEALELVDDETVRQHWLRHELLQRLRSRALLRLSPPEQKAAVEGVRGLLPGFSDASFEALPAVPRARADLAADGRTDELIRLAAWEHGLNADCETEEAVLSGSLLQWRGRLTPHGLPQPPAPPADSVGFWSDHEADPVSTAELLFTSQDGDGEFAVPVELPAGEIRITAGLQTVAAGGPLPSGRWRLSIRQEFAELGIARTAALLDHGMPLAVLIDPLLGMEIRALHMPVVRQRRGLVRRLLNR